MNQNNIRITSISNPLIQKLLKLKNKNFINSTRYFLIEGKNNIDKAIENGELELILVIDEKDYLKFNKRILVNQKIIDKLKQTISNENYIGVSKVPKNISFSIPENEFFNNILILDNINNPGNLGTIIRSAVGFGVDAIFLINNSVHLLNQKVISASQGTIFDIKIFQISDFDESYFQNYNHLLFSLNKKAISLNEISQKKYERSSLVFGNEAKGINFDLFKNQNFEYVFIPISKKLESLNVSIAASIALFYFSNY